jgi:monofunctional biosynthetic peptidoglycan transglycosylase
VKTLPLLRRVHGRLFIRGAVVVCLVFLAFSMMQVLLIRWFNPPASAFMVERRLEGVVNPSRRITIDHRWAGWDEIAPPLKLAVLAAEDQNFMEHRGFDFEAIRRAIEHNQSHDRMRGGSTISQQVAKNMFLWPGRNIVRKGLEAWYTVLIETFWTKQRILEVYLNVAEFGEGVYGVGAASRKYFNKKPSRVTRHESALLAAVLPNPRRFHVDRPTVYVHRRSWWIERQMSRMERDGLARREAVGGGA